MTENNEGTITIKKDALWKYSTFALLAVLVIGGILWVLPNNPTTTGNVVANPGNTVAPFSDKVFEDTNLYPTMGPDNAKNVVIEFADFQCPYCALASGLPSWIPQYESQYGDLVVIGPNLVNLAESGDIKFVYVSMSFLGQESVYAAQAGLCANKQDKFWEMHDAIATAHDMKENNGKYSKANLETIAATIQGIDTAKFNKCLENDETLSDVQKIANDARTSGVSGTPTFFVNGQKVSSSWQAIKASL
ncbi:hypothetical protein AUJ84_01195 [Candidatus Pacearchaeota archaeon CG1_02_32_132]|nr:MAG: hypothetical protein AUJ84_01195 [Candidatus Pacearchaeota archaeon CG1_02_32_132]